ncbi:MAG: hypothetical protein FWG79_03710, partial [Bacteroidales bacterium]|nr:hypothetical protein [Bacteroidales bacterium]
LPAIVTNANEGDRKGRPYDGYQTIFGTRFGEFNLQFTDLRFTVIASHAVAKQSICYCGLLRALPSQ